jgi:hypothetical protein
MGVNQVSLRLQSETMTVAELTDLVGVPPTSAAERGSSVSSRRPSGPVHTATTIDYRASANGIDLKPYIAVLQPILERLMDRHLSVDCSVDLVVAITGRPMGFISILEPATIYQLGTVGCGVVFDVYSDGEPEG